MTDLTGIQRVYCAGPITADPHGFERAFADAAASLRYERGFTVINPVEHDSEEQILAAREGVADEELWRSALRRDLGLLVTCDAVAVLPGWVKSRGARLEVYVARALGMPVLWADTLDEVIHEDEASEVVPVDDYDTPPPALQQAADRIRAENRPAFQKYLEASAVQWRNETQSTHYAGDDCPGGHEIEIIGLSGYARAGKDTVGEILGRYGYQRVAFADKLKELAYATNPVVGAFINQHDGIERDRLSDLVDTYGWEVVKGGWDESREFLQRLGVAARDVLGSNVWVDAALSTLPSGKYVVTDVRFPNEAEAIKTLGGEVWRVERPGTGPVNGHESETALDSHGFDATIDNSGSLEDLADRVEGALLSRLWGIRHEPRN